MREKITEELKRALIIMAGCILYSAALSLFLSPANLAPGGISGLAIVLNRLIPVSVGILTFVLNIPLFFLGFIKLGKKFMIHTISATVVSSVLMDILTRMSENNMFTVPITSEPLLNALFGGALVGVGIGLIMHGGGSTGGTDIVARVLRLKYRHIKTGTFFLLIDAGIIAASAFVFKDLNCALYAALSDFVTTILLDRVLYGGDEAKMLLIISRHPVEIAENVMDELGAGATYLEGSGAYTADDRKVLLCALHKSQFSRAREIVRDIDLDAFMIVTTATEIYGEGYKAHDGVDL